MLGELLVWWKAEGRTVVMTTHNLEHGLAWGERVAILSGAKIAFEESRLSLDMVGFRGTYRQFLETTGLRDFLGPVAALAWKDILLEIRSRDIVVSVVVFSLLVVVMFSFALNVTPTVVKELAPGILWVSFVFAGVLAMNRAFVLGEGQGKPGRAPLGPCEPRRDLFWEDARDIPFYDSRGGSASAGVRCAPSTSPLTPPASYWPSCWQPWDSLL